jgi:hypothetical protein
MFTSRLLFQCAIALYTSCYLLVEIILRTGLSDPSHYHVIDATSVNSFKNRLYNHWKNIEIKFVSDFYGPEEGISRNDNVMDLRGQS